MDSSVTSLSSVTMWTWPTPVRSLTSMDCPRPLRPRRRVGGLPATTRQSSFYDLARSRMRRTDLRFWMLVPGGRRTSVKSGKRRKQPSLKCALSRGRDLGHENGLLQGGRRSDVTEGPHLIPLESEEALDRIRRGPAVYLEYVEGDGWSQEVEIAVFMGALPCRLLDSIFHPPHLDWTTSSNMGELFFWRVYKPAILCSLPGPLGTRSSVGGFGFGLAPMNGIARALWTTVVFLHPGSRRPFQNMVFRRQELPVFGAKYGGVF